MWQHAVLTLLSLRISKDRRQKAEGSRQKTKSNAQKEKTVVTERKQEAVGGLLTTHCLLPPAFCLLPFALTRYHLGVYIADLSGPVAGDNRIKRVITSTAEIEKYLSSFSKSKRLAPSPQIPKSDLSPLEA